MKQIDDIQSTRIGVVGAGSWGTALAKLLAEKGFGIDFWVFEPEVKEQIETFRENKVFLPGFSLPDSIRPSNDIEIVVRDKDLILVVVPSHCMRSVVIDMKPFVSRDAVVVSASKGIENKTHLTMTGILAEILDFLPPDNLAVLSGPSFAKEVAARIPTVVAAASVSDQVARFVQAVFACPTFRVYVNHDPVGTQIGGGHEKCAGHCRRHLRRNEHGAESPGRPGSPGADGNESFRHPAGGGSVDPVRPGRGRRSAAYLHRRLEPQLHGGVQIGQGKNWMTLFLKCAWWPKG